jgi:hypothetical protein
MKKIIKLKESDLIRIVNRVLNEQSVIGAPNMGVTTQTKSKTSSSVSPSLLPCVPTAFKLSVQNFIKKNYNKTFLKTTLGIIGRESDFGESNRFKFTARLKYLWAALGGQTSVGYAQIKPETAEKYGMKISDLNFAYGSVDTAYKIIQDNYKIALKVGYTEQPSVNIKDGTGNSALDIAIAAFNLGASKITRYCKTSNPKINRPCSLAGKTIKEQDGSIEFAMNRKNQQQLLNEQSVIGAPNMGMTTQIRDSGKSITVTNQYVPNYIPNFKTKRWDGVKISSHGYISEVAQRIKTYTCF